MKSNATLACALALSLALGPVACGTNSQEGEAVETAAAEISAGPLDPEAIELDIAPDTVLGLEEGCPYTWDSVRVVYPEKDSASTPDTVWVGTELGLIERTLGHEFSGPQAVHNIPEYHDCQRFIIDPPAVDSVFAIVATQPEDLENRMTSVRGPVLAAQIWTRGGEYGPLGLRPGFNCLYLWETTGAGLKAHIRHSGRRVRCPRSLDFFPEPPLLLPLKVIQTSYAGGPGAPPPTARWEWDPLAGEYRIGLRCRNDAWCEITMDRPGLQAIDHLANRASNLGTAIGSGAPWGGAKLDRAVIKGWYDEQVLDIFVGGQLVSSGIRGFAVPDPEIGIYQDTLDYLDTLIVSAYTFLDTLAQVHDSAFVKYLEKMNFGRTDWDRPNIIKICKPGPKSCGVDPHLLPPCSAPPPLGDFVAEITNAETQDKSYQCVARCDHSSTLVPATARWRGVENDAKLWMRCAQGCCTVQ